MTTRIPRRLTRKTNLTSTVLREEFLCRLDTRAAVVDARMHEATIAVGAGAGVDVDREAGATRV